jgi:hypothetical protein
LFENENYVHGNNYVPVSGKEFVQVKIPLETEELSVMDSEYVELVGTDRKNLSGAGERPRKTRNVVGSPVRVGKTKRYK